MDNSIHTRLPRLVSKPDDALISEEHDFTVRCSCARVWELGMGDRIDTLSSD